MQTVRSPKEAMNWFLGHSSGTVKCVKGNAEKEVDNYPDAVAFFGEEESSPKGDPYGYNAAREEVSSSWRNEIYREVSKTIKAHGATYIRSDVSPIEVGNVFSQIKSIDAPDSIVFDGRTYIHEALWFSMRS